MAGKRERKRLEEKKLPQEEIFISLLKGGGVSSLVLLGLMMAGAWAVALGSMSQEMMRQWGMLSCVVAGLAGGMAAVWKKRSWTVVLGLETGGILFLLLLLFGIMLYGQPPTVKELISVLLCCLCGGGMAGMFGRTGKKKRKR